MPLRHQEPTHPDPADRHPSAAGADIPPAALRRSMVVSIVASALGMMFFNIILGSVFAQYVRKLGLEGTFPFLMSILPLTALVQILSTFVMERLASRRLFFFACNGAVRLIWLAIGSLPLWTSDHLVLLDVLVALLFLYGILQSTGNVAWMSWMADLVPEAARGRYFGFRQTICSTSGAIAGVAAGYFVTVRQDSMESFWWVFVVAAVFGVADIVLFAFVYHPPHKNEADRPAFLEMARRCWRQAGFRRLLTAMAPWHFGNMIMWPFITLFMLGPLEMSVYQVGLIQATGTFFHVIFASLFGVFMDRYGHRTSLILCLMLHFTVPLLYLFATPEFTHPVWLAWVVGMILGPTIQNVQITLLMSHSERRGQSMAFAVYGLFVGVIMFSAPNIGQWFSDQVSPGAKVTLLGRAFYPAQLLIASGALFRFSALLLALRLPAEQRMPGTGIVIRQVLSTDPFRALASLYRFVRVNVSAAVGDGSYARQHPSARWQAVSPEETSAREQTQKDESLHEVCAPTRRKNCRLESKDQGSGAPNQKAD